VHCPSGSRRLRPHRLSPALGSASPEVPRPYDALSPGAPLCHDRFDRSQETRDTTPSSGSVLGLSQPLDGFSRDCATSPSCPEPTVPPSLRPEASRPCCMPQASLGFTLQSFPLPRSRPASSAGSSSLRVRRRPYLRREGPSAVRPVSAALRAPASPGAPREEDVPCGHERGCVASPRSSDRLSTPRVAPLSDLDGRQETFGLAGVRPFRPLRSFAPPGSPFSRPTARCPRTLARRCSHGRPGRCSPGFSPLQSFLRHDPGFGRLRRSPGTPSARGSPSPVPDNGNSGLRS